MPICKVLSYSTICPKTGSITNYSVLVFVYKAENIVKTIFYVEFKYIDAIIYNRVILQTKSLYERIGEIMAVSYKKLWKILIDRDMKKKDLAEKANLSSYTINKMNRGDNVTTDTLVKICGVLDCTFDDIAEIIPDENAGQ